MGGMHFDNKDRQHLKLKSLKNVGTQIYQRIEESNLSLKIRVVNPEDLCGLGTFSWNRNYLFRIRIRAK